VLQNLIHYCRYISESAHILNHVLNHFDHFSPHPLLESNCYEMIQETKHLSKEKVIEYFKELILFCNGFDTLDTTQTKEQRALITTKKMI